MKYHKFYTFFSDFVERDNKAGGFCVGGRPPRSPRAAAQALAPLPALRATPYPAGAALFAGNPADSLAAHAAKIG